MADDGGGSRLDRLLRLLETGSSPAARHEAARQIGELASAHPNQLPNLLRRIRGFLKHKQWETRVAAAKTIAHICQGVKHCTVADIARLEGIDIGELMARVPNLPANNEDDELGAGDLNFAEFDLESVLNKAAPLLAAKKSDMSMFSVAGEESLEDKKLTKAERLRLAKQSLKQRLGMALDSSLEGAAGEDEGGEGGKQGRKAAGDDAPKAANLDVDKFVDVDDLVNEEDMDDVKQTQVDVDAEKIDATDLGQLSARERNRLKRKMKRGVKDEASGVDVAVTAKRHKTGGVGEDPEIAKRLALEQAEEEDEANEVEAGGWPLARTCENLAYSLFAPRWEERHGAAAALREVLRTHAASAAVPAPPARSVTVAPDTSARAAKRNAAWLEDAAVRLLCVLSLDRFGDYVGDGVVAPVRETCAQALGAGLLPLPPTAVAAVVTTILVLLKRNEWEVRHSALLALRYVLASRPDLAPLLLPDALPAATRALSDKDDDVRGAAAEALLPASTHLPMHAEFPPLLSGLWSLLGRLDDPDLLTSPSNVPVMSLLAALYALPVTQNTPPLLKKGSSLKDVVPYLFPFAAHPIAAVRLAVWRTLRQLMGRGTADTGGPSKRDVSWIHDVATTALRVSFQAVLLEEDETTAHAASSAWSDLCHVASAAAIARAVDGHAQDWCLLAATQTDSRPDPKLLCVVSLSPSGRNPITGADDRAPSSTEEWVVRTVGRLRAVSALSELAKVLCAVDVDSDVTNALLKHTAAKKLETQVTFLMHQPSATRRATGAYLLTRWLDAIPVGAPKPPLEVPGARLGEILAATNPAYPSAPSPNPYAEATALVARVKRESAGLLRAAADNNVKPTTSEIPSPAADGFGAEHAVTLAAAIPTGPSGVESARGALLASAARLRVEEQRLHSISLAAAAGAAVAFGALPSKLNPFIQPLMGSVRREGDGNIQATSALSLAKLIKICVGRVPSPVNKIAGNVVSLACGDSAVTPRVEWDDVAIEVSQTAASTHDGPTEASVARIGAEKTLVALCDVFGDTLFADVPKLWETMFVPLVGTNVDGSPLGGDQNVSPQSVVDACCVLKVLGAKVVSSLDGDAFSNATKEKVLALITPAFNACTRKDAAVATQRCASAALASLASAAPDTVVPRILTLVVPALENAGEADDAAGARRGAAAVAYSLVESLGNKLAPFCVLLLVPLMGRMSDAVDKTRNMATKSFAQLVPLLPLARGVPAPDSLTVVQKKRSENDGAFLEALLDNSKVDDFVLPFKCARTLRPYQQEGVNWLAFLRRFKLHGALCDDMGLGKTLQSTCILAATVCERRQEKLPFLPALVVCPPTLVGHWAHEISQYVGADVLNPLEYQGNPGERAALRPRISSGKHDVVIMSYDSLRADIDILALHTPSWCYCILDEGHAIRNPKSRVTQAVKKIRAEHRLLLSGTPIQNDVVELWSLFDFLMPGFLGTEREFKTVYGVAASRSAAAKKGGGLTEQGALATGKLHKQVMPFVMRRTKDEVLKDLPPKIIQDVYVDLSPYQKKLYDAFEGSAVKTDIETVVKGGDAGASGGGGGTAHVFQALQYLRKLCSHPRLVTAPASSGKKGTVANGLGARTSESWSPKFRALKQILLDCGVGVDKVPSEDPEDDVSGSNPRGGAGHRVLIFSQLKAVLDLVEDELFGSRGELGGVSWLRLDGGVAPTARFDVVRKFNADPSIDVLLLTTHVGGLGLNLTSADTVVFLEHDWNPQKDLQAMDRAHRLGQKRTVNVYRLLTKGTLEEKVMSLQRFKLDVANAVVNSDNMSLSAMDTGQMLELFTAEKGSGAGGGTQSAPAAGGAGAAAADAVAGGLKQALTGLDDLWDESQYKEEFGLDGFIQSLNK